MEPLLVGIENLSVNLNGKDILRNIYLEIRRGEQWALLGKAGSGKTVFAHAMAGRLSSQGHINFSRHPENKKPISIAVTDQFHRFKNLQNLSNFYYQQRYNSQDAGATKTIRDELSSFSMHDSSLWTSDTLLRIFCLDALLDEPLIQLSNGENKRWQILKSLLVRPDLLILDEPFTGLDSEGRKTLDLILQTLSADGQQFLLLSGREHLPECFNRFAILENGALTSVEKSVAEKFGVTSDSNEKTKAFPEPIGISYPEFKYAVRMENVHVQYEGKMILEDIQWKIKAGECWALTGHNGAGKSTLLSLITADNPQAYANEIYLFDRRRGSGESIWEIKKNLGFLSPELHLYFDPAATVFTTLASGLFDTTGLFRALNDEQISHVQHWLEFLDCKTLGGRLLSTLPAGMQRMILLGRALIKTPPLLVLDEPFQGLDRNQRDYALNLVDQYVATFRPSMIFVSHYEEDFPASITNFIRLHKGNMS